MTWTKKRRPTPAALTFVSGRFHHEDVGWRRDGRPGWRVAGPAVTVAELVCVPNIALLRRSATGVPRGQDDGPWEPPF